MVILKKKVDFFFHGAELVQIGKSHRKMIVRAKHKTK